LPAQICRHWSFAGRPALQLWGGQDRMKNASSLPASYAHCGEISSALLALVVFRFS
jgi:hypothetical protein